MDDENIYLGVGVKGHILKVVALPIEDYNREEIKAVCCDAIDLIYDGEYSTIDD